MSLPFPINKFIFIQRFLKKIPITFHRKRIFDLIFSGLVLLVFFPLFLVLALGIKFSSKGPIIYKQKRIGREGKIFECYKLRTMHQDAEKILDKILKENPLLKQEWDKKQKLKNDPRIFPFGHFLRKTSLDEFPQFWNVLKGDLSVVGPRPYMECQKEMLGPRAYLILSLRPGITGLWQTRGRSSTSFKERIELDAKYVQNRSFWFDIALIVKTLHVILFPKNAC